MAKVAVVAKLVTKPGRRAEAVEALRALVGAARDEPGTEVYVLHEAAGDDETLWVYEMYTDQEALATHSSSDAMKQVGGRLADLLAAPPDIILTRPVESKGLAVE